MPPLSRGEARVPLGLKERFAIERDRETLFG
jgi:hypothetical protein